MIRNQALVVKKWENAIHWIIIYIADSMIKASSLFLKICDEKKTEYYLFDTLPCQEDTPDNKANAANVRRKI